MKLLNLLTPGLAIRTYLLIDEESKKAAVIDPPRNVDAIVQILRQHQAELLYIFETHVHADFISGAKELRAAFEGKPVIGCSILGGEKWFPEYGDIKIEHLDKFPIGSDYIESWHVPGHTPEHMMYILYQENIPVAAFTGDFLFVGSIGRPDLLQSIPVKQLAEQLYTSVFTTLPKLPDDVRIFPSHGAGSLCGKAISSEVESTLGKEWKNNPALQVEEKNVWKAKILEGMPKAPPYFAKLKELNVKGAPLLKDLPEIKVLQPSELKNPFECFILDVRNPEIFAKAHLQNSINIGWAESFARWMGNFVPYDQPILLIASNRNEAEQAINALRLIGLDAIVGMCITDEEFFKHFADKISTFPMPDGEDLLKQIAQVQVVDVRTDNEWKSGHIKDAIHCELDSIADKIQTLPQSKPIAFVCGGGYRSSIASSLAQKMGLNNIINLKGGMRDWKKKNLPSSM